MTAAAAPADLPLAVALAEAADRAAEWPGLGRRDPSPMRIVVVPDARRLAELTGGRAPEWGVAIAVPAARTIAVRADGGDPMGALRHELAHLALHEALGRTRVPLWFDEGYAVLAAREYGRFAALALNLAVARGAPGGLGALDRALRDAEPTAETAYALAATAVAELGRRHPEGTLAPLMGRLERGERFEDAVLATTGLTLDRFDEAWQRTIRRRYGLAAWFLAGGAWLVIAVAVIGAARVRRRADRPRRARLDEGWEIPEPVEEPELDPPSRPD